MRGLGGGGPTLALMWWLVGFPAAAAAQVAPNRATSYLHPTDVRDARALWVNPAELGVSREASVHLDLTVGEPGARGRVQQVTAGFNSRGLSFGYQRDVFDGGGRGHTYRVGLAGSSGAGRLAGGVAGALYRGQTSSTGWDLGLVYAGRVLAAGGVIANIGQPVVRGFRQRVTYVPGATLHPFGPQAALSWHGRITSTAVMSYSFGLRWSWAARLPLEVTARLDTDRGLRRGAFAFAISLGRLNRLGIVATTPGDVSTVEAASVYGVATSPMTR